MGQSFRLDELLDERPVRGVAGARAADSTAYRLDDLLGDSSAVQSPRSPGDPGGDVDLRTGPATAPAATPARGRGIGARIAEFFETVGRYAGPGPEQLSGTTLGRYEEPEQRFDLVRPKPLTDRRTEAERRAAREATRQIATHARSDVTRVAPAGSPQQAAERSATQAGLAAKEVNERNFTPRNLRDVASRGDRAADELLRKADAMAPVNAEAAQALREQAEQMKAKAANAETVASAAESADTFSEIARSSLIGIVHDPNAPAKRAMLEYAADPSLSFTPEEQTRDLGKNLPVGRSRGFSWSKDVSAPLVGSLPLYLAGGVAGRAAVRGIAGGLEAINAPRAASIARALATEIETTGLAAGETRLAGMAGVRQATTNLRQNLGKLAVRGATEGQVVGAVQAAREAQQIGADPVQAAAMSTLLNVPGGVVSEVGLGALTRYLGVADRSVAGALDRVLERADALRGRRPLDDFEAIGSTWDVPDEHLAAMDQGAEVAGQTPVSDKTPEGQRSVLAQSLEALLSAKQAAAPGGPQLGPEPPRPAGAAWWEDALGPQSLVEPVERVGRGPRDENPPLRSALDVAQARAPRDEADATVQMQRAAEEARLMEEELAREQEQLRLEQAAVEREAREMGPLTLRETLERAAQDRTAGEPLATEYHEAINKMADVAARMEDATKDGGTPSAALKVQFARARSTLNEMRQKYGTQAASGAVLALAATDEDLTDEERQMAGLGALVVTGKAAKRADDAAVKALARPSRLYNFELHTAHDLNMARINEVPAETRDEMVHALTKTVVEPVLESEGITGYRTEPGLGGWFSEGQMSAQPSITLHLPPGIPDAQAHRIAARISRTMKQSAFFDVKPKAGGGRAAVYFDFGREVDDAEFGTFMQEIAAKREGWNGFTRTANEKGNTVAQVVFDTGVGDDITRREAERIIAALDERGFRGGEHDAHEVAAREFGSARYRALVERGGRPAAHSRADHLAENSYQAVARQVAIEANNEKYRTRFEAGNPTTEYVVPSVLVRSSGTTYLGASHMEAMGAAKRAGEDVRADFSKPEGEQDATIDGFDAIDEATGARRFVTRAEADAILRYNADAKLRRAMRQFVDAEGNPKAHARSEDLRNAPVTYRDLYNRVPDEIRGGYPHAEYGGDVSALEAKLPKGTRSAIERAGLPVVAALAALAAGADDAEAQDGRPRGMDLYGTAIGGMAAGALIASLAANRKLRSLVKENRALNRALHLDDLSGLSNKRALTRAIESVDRDESVGWIVLDGNSFKKLNDAHGHPEGDKAIAHFGKTLRDVAEELGVPMRGFRAGGDEFAFAAPKERIAEVLRAIEERSPYTKGEVTTSLTGAHGDTFAEADALLTAQKAATRVPRDLPPAVAQGVTLYANPIGPALAELRRAPGTAGIAAIGVLASQEDDNEYVRRAGLPIIGLAAMHAIGSRRIGVGIDMLAQGIVEQLRKTHTGTSVARFLNPDRLIPPEALAAIKQYERDRARAAARASQIAQKAKALGPQGDRAVSDVLDNEEWEGLAAQTPEVLAVSIELADELEQATQAQLAAGTLDPDDVIEDYGGPRKYAFYEVAAALADKPGKGGAPSRNPRVVKTETRTLDLPIREAQRALDDAVASGDAVAIKEAQDALDFAKLESMAKRVERGEIRESSYRTAAGIEKAYQNVAAAKLFETLRATPGVAHPEWVKAVDDYQAATAIRRSVRGGTQADIDAAEALVREATGTLDDLKRRYSQKGQDYVALPDSPSWGMLRGAIVQRDVAHSLTGFGSPNTFVRMLKGWKESKTVFNVGTSVGNILSNSTALHVKGLSAWMQPIYYRRALKDLQSYGEAAKALTEAGVMHVNAVNADGQALASSSMRSAAGLEELLGTTRPETAAVIRRESEQNSQYAITEAAIADRAQKRLAAGVAIGAGVGAVRGYDEENPERMGVGAAIGAGIGALAAKGKLDLIRKLYGHEDNLARMAFFLHRRNAGDTIEQATEAAIDALADFRTRSPALRMVGLTVSPFILYQAKAIPAFAKSIIDHPYRYLSLVAAWAAVNELSKAEVGEIPEEDRDLRDRATWGYFFPGMTQLPITNEEGDRGATDFSRYTPFGGLATGAPPGTLPEALNDDAPQVATPGGPVIDLALRASNLHPLTKEPLVRSDAPGHEKIATLLREATDFALPSSVGFHLRRITTDYDNQDWERLKNDLLGPLGTKPRYVRAGAPQTRARYELDKTLRDIQYKMRRELDANKNPERDSLIIERAMERQIRAMEAYDRRTNPPEKGARP